MTSHQRKMWTYHLRQGQIELLRLCQSVTERTSHGTIFYANDALSECSVTVTREKHLMCEHLTETIRFEARPRQDWTQRDFEIQMARIRAAREMLLGILERQSWREAAT